MTGRRSGTETSHEKQLLTVLRAVRKGDFSARMPGEEAGIAGRIGDTLNEIIELNERMTKELARVSNVVGKEGKVSERASLGTLTGSWGTSLESVNSIITDLVQP